VARSEPLGVRLTAASGELCAGTSHTTWRLMQSCTTTVPAEVEDGKASKELSASELSAHTPRVGLPLPGVRLLIWTPCVGLSLPAVINWCFDCKIT
jgi:hypothetical protein